MARVAIVGLATVDYVLTTEHPIRGPGTFAANVLVRSAWPRAGGAALYAARRIAAAGHVAWPIVSIGSGANGRAYRDACLANGANLEGIVQLESSKTPCCLLIYHADGGYTCLLDVGTAALAELSMDQTTLVAAADLVVIAAANAHCIGTILDQLEPDQRCAWIAKNDTQCFPVGLCERLTERADIIFCNGSELHMIEVFVEHARPTMTLFETRGAAGVRVRTNGTDHFVDAVPVAIDDATGAGDTFAGEVLASMLSGETDPIAAARRGVLQVRELLVERTLNER